MNVTGLVLLLAFSVLVVGWVLNLVRLGRLYVGYAVAVVLAVALGAPALAIPPLRRLAWTLLMRIYPTEGATLVLSAVVVVALVYVLSQLSILSNRLATLTQELAILSAARSDQRSEKPAEAADRPE
jgi:hypothetical protein